MTTCPNNRLFASRLDSFSVGAVEWSCSFRSIYFLFAEKWYGIIELFK